MNPNKTETPVIENSDDHSSPPDSQTQSTAPGSSPHRRNGKVARLPKELRELVNVMLNDGAPYPVIVQKIAEHGHDLNPDNLSRWHSGGYQDWLREQSWLEEMRHRLDFASDIMQQDNGDLIDSASLRIAVLRMFSLIGTFDPFVLSDKLRQQPGAYARILNVLCKLTDSAIKLERQRMKKARKF
jgi:hypothetical protein